MAFAACGVEMNLSVRGPIRRRRWTVRQTRAEGQKRRANGMCTRYVLGMYVPCTRDGHGLL